MRDADREPLATIALIAAFADGFRAPEEVAQLKTIAAEIGGGDYDTIARRVLSGQSALGDVVARLSDDEARRKAYELAVSVVYADGVATEQEKTFLADLRRSLGLDGGVVAEVDQAGAGLGAAVADPGVAEEPAAPSAPFDDQILQTAMLAAAVELLPQNLATMAIVPLQLRMVYRIGQQHGHRLDAAQVKDLAGVFGIGAAGQVVEGVARKLLGGLARGIFGRGLGGAAGGLTGAAAGVALTFATTYALGHAAQQYYAQGRALSRADLQALFARLKDDAGGIFPRVERQIRDLAGTLDLGEVMRRVRA
ncbi:MAG: GTPase [Gemmatimonadetes bacterium]|nr:GTPase [Gemmatimonadota bacterium]